MTASASGPRRPAWPLALALAMAAIGWFLYQRNAGLQPSVFADEWYYSKMARLAPLADAIVPSYLYLWIFRGSSACGDGFLDCVRIGNLAFYLGAAPFLYLLARRYSSGAAACGVAVLGLLAPLNSFTAYFMPESMYYFGFCVLSWAALAGSGWRPAVQALATGAILGLMSLVKVHALFLLPALCLFLLAASRPRGGAWLPRGIAMAGLAAAAAFAIKFGLGWAFAGKAGLSLFGPFYESTHIGTDKLALLVAASVSARGHLMVLALMYALPLAILVHDLCLRTLRARAPVPAAPATPDGRALLHLYVVLMLGAAAGLTILYTAGLAVPGSREGFRLHLRYYSFVFPLLAAVAAAALAPQPQAGRPLAPWDARLRRALALLLCMVLAVSLSRLPGFTTNVVDGPDIYGIDLAGTALRVVAALQALVLLAWAARVRAAPLLFLGVALPAAYAASNEGVDRHLAAQRPPNQTDLAARYVHRHVPPAERGKVVVVGADMSLILRAQFHIDHPDTSMMVLEKFGPVAEYQLPLNKKWMLMLGQYQVPAHITTVLSTPYYSVVRLPEPELEVGRVTLSAPTDPRVVAGIEGLSHIEPWGRWSDAKQVVIHFARPLPRRVGVVLSARAYDVNATLPFTARLGGQSREFRAGWHLNAIGLHFETSGDARTLVIDVPQPVSPAERGQPGDTRRLGIGIGEIIITDAARPAQAAR